MCERRLQKRERWSMRARWKRGWFRADPRYAPAEFLQLYQEDSVERKKDHWGFEKQPYSFAPTTTKGDHNRHHPRRQHGQAPYHSSRRIDGYVCQGQPEVTGTRDY